jgi:hypothetical protein
VSPWVSLYIPVCLFPCVVPCLSVSLCLHGFLSTSPCVCFPVSPWVSLYIPALP